MHPKSHKLQTFGGALDPFLATSSHLSTPVLLSESLVAQNAAQYKKSITQQVY